MVRLVSEKEEEGGGGGEREWIKNLVFHVISALGRLRLEDYLNLRIQKFQNSLGSVKNRAKPKSKLC